MNDEDIPIKRYPEFDRNPEIVTIPMDVFEDKPPVFYELVEIRDG